MKTKLHLTNSSKNVLSFIMLLMTIVLVNSSIMAQVPEKISYQAIVRDANGDLITNSDVGIQITILQGSDKGDAVYVETQTPETDENGLISIAIGEGNSTDSFTDIDWADGSYFIQIEIDIDGGTYYTITGVSQILSVPYAFHSKTAHTVDYQNITNVPDIPSDLSDLTDDAGLLFSGDYNDLINTPNIADSISVYGFSGDYDDLINKPFIPSDVSDLTDTTELIFDRDYNSLIYTPNIIDSIQTYGFSGDYNDLANRPSDGVNSGDMRYWDGNNWVIIPGGSSGQPLVFCNGVPQWGPCNDAKEDEPIFRLDNAEGIDVLAVYAGGVEITVDDNPDPEKSARGSFAVGGFTTTKGNPVDFLVVTPDSVRVYIRADEDSKSARGSFAVGGFTTQKEPLHEAYMTISSDTTFVNTPMVAAGSLNVGGNLNLGGDFVNVPVVETVSHLIETGFVALNGAVISDGGGEIIEKGFYYSTSDNPETTGIQVTAVKSGESKTEPFAVSIPDTALTLGQTYYYRAYAKNSVGKSFGIVLSFIFEN